MGLPGQGRGVGGRSFPKCRCEGQARGYEGDRRCGDVLEEKKKTHKKYIWGK